MIYLKSKVFIFSFLSILLTSCCDCFDHEPVIGVKYAGFTKAELKSIYLIYVNSADTSFNIVDTIDNSNSIWASTYGRYRIKSDSIPLDKYIYVKKLDIKRSIGFCRCIKSTDITLEYDGKELHNEPVIIIK
jgi:hypothetical protein